MSRVRFLPEAETELLHEVEHYSAAGAGVGVRFQAMVEAAVHMATRHPRGGSRQTHGVRAVLVRGFPFSVVYRASKAELLIVAIAAHRRRPGYWKPRVGKR